MGKWEKADLNRSKNTQVRLIGNETESRLDGALAVCTKARIAFRPCRSKSRRIELPKEPAAGSQTVCCRTKAPREALLTKRRNHEVTQNGDLLGILSAVVCLPKLRTAEGVQSVFALLFRSGCPTAAWLCSFGYHFCIYSGYSFGHSNLYENNFTRSTQCDGR